MRKSLWIACVVVGMSLGIACGDDDGGKVSEEDAVATCEEFCEMDACTTDPADVETCKGLCGLAGVIAACGNGQAILDAQAACYEMATCDEQQACLNASPACEE
jgi:hypothetical protein